MRYLALCLLLFTFTPIYAAKIKDICKIISRHPKWYAATQQTQAKWGVPVPIQLAIIKQESNFKATAKNAKSSAYGYAQAVNKIWHDYQKTQHIDASRSNFKADSNFIGWYANQLKDQDGLSLKNAYSLYLAYHDGGSGYKQDMHHGAKGSGKLAANVQRTAQIYKAELSSC